VHEVLVNEELAELVDHGQSDDLVLIVDLVQDDAHHCKTLTVLYHFVLHTYTLLVHNERTSHQQLLKCFLCLVDDKLFSMFSEFDSQFLRHIFQEHFLLQQSQHFLPEQVPR